MPDQTMACRDCGASFVFTTSEQEFFAQKGFTNPPTRCASCRAARKAERGEGGGFGRGGNYSTRERQMYPATCAQCGKETEVPFEPRGDRPVYCSDCYTQHRPASTSGGGGSRGGYGGDRGGSGGGGYGGDRGGNGGYGGGGGRRY